MPVWLFDLIDDTTLKYREVWEQNLWESLWTSKYDIYTRWWFQIFVIFTLFEEDSHQTSIDLDII